MAAICALDIIIVYSLYLEKKCRNMRAPFATETLYLIEPIHFSAYQVGQWRTQSTRRAKACSSFQPYTIGPRDLSNYVGFATPNQITCLVVIPRDVENMACSGEGL